MSKSSFNAASKDCISRTCLEDLTHGPKMPDQDPLKFVTALSAKLADNSATLTVAVDE